MSLKRFVQFAFIVMVLLFGALLHRTIAPMKAFNGPRTGGLEETMFNLPSAITRYDRGRSANLPSNQRLSHQSTTTGITSGTLNRKAHNYSRIMVVPRVQKEDVAWVTKELPGLDLLVYTVNDPNASTHPPKNKGHEVVVYLSYLIDHYDRLPDIVLFMHAHRWTHHNNELLGFDASQMVRSLNSAYVVREGYVNIRCHWRPGCPEWLHPNNQSENLGKQEETMLEKCWEELFPFDPLPPYLAQPCCAQFALSRDRILSIPRSRYVFYRDWILKTPLSDYISGRIWEYSWQFIFTYKSSHCVPEHICYCDGFGICFGGKAQYQDFSELRLRKEHLEAELKTDWGIQKSSNGPKTIKGNVTALEQASNKFEYSPSPEIELKMLEAELEKQKETARIRGANPRLRAEECGRQWNEGDEKE